MDHTLLGTSPRAAILDGQVVPSPIPEPLGHLLPLTASHFILDLATVSNEVLEMGESMAVIADVVRTLQGKPKAQDFDQDGEDYLIALAQRCLFFENSLAASTFLSYLACIQLWRATLECVENLLFNSDNVTDYFI